jgi:endonuclease YncB( thermonuclease family)
MLPRGTSARRLAAAALLAAAAFASGCTAEEPPEPAVVAEAETGGEAGEPQPASAPRKRKTKKPKRVEVEVTRVVDGDTIDVSSGKRVRLVQIDTPEAGGECYGAEAAAELGRLLPVGTRVALERDPALDNADRYGRLLRYVFKDGTNVNLVLVRRGAASVWFYDGERGRYADQLHAAAEKASRQGRGAWGACRAKLTPFESFDTHPKNTRTASGGAGGKCHPSYTGPCLDPNASDYDCAGGSGDGPLYTGKVRVVGPDVFGLDPDGDGWGCE